MKAAVFDYIRADDAQHALELLGEHGPDSKLIAGGQTLVPMMAMRLARPSLLIDIHRLEELRNITLAADSINLGSAVRQCEVERHTGIGQRLPLIHQALRWVGHQQTRNRGTVGGSVVYADPSAELPLAALILGACMHLKSQGGSVRSVQADEFFLGPMYTEVQDTELLTSIDWPIWQGPGVVSAFEETAIRHGDFAMASAACQLKLSDQGIIERASFGVGGVNGTPMLFKDLAEQLIGQRMSQDLADEVAYSATKLCEPGNDMHASAAYRRHLASALLARVLMQATTPK
jgi:carbon-monoxide dehydrogenase medium subunit/2-furoyl-CoA dehydrogenase FAD binding subunit